jgi:hypothetical protein
MLFRAEFMQEAKYATLYMPVTDKAGIARLHRRLDDLKD